MKYYSNDGFNFVCDRCGKVAGTDKSEQKALAMARRVAEAQGWNWEHPGWGLKCPSCQSRKQGKAVTIRMS